MDHDPHRSFDISLWPHQSISPACPAQIILARTTADMMKLRAQDLILAPGVTVRAGGNTMDIHRARDGASAFIMWISLPDTGSHYVMVQGGTAASHDKRTGVPQTVILSDPSVSPNGPCRPILY
jgi:hypothetical protein